ncbi:MAG: carboxypeptidase regulatory-like domain-containing protein, partial [Planctomycetota bacterium]
MGSPVRRNRGFWGVGLLLGALVFLIMNYLLPEVAGPTLRRDRNVQFAGAGSPSLFPIKRDDRPEKSDEPAKEAAAPEEKVEELPPYGDKTLPREKAIRGRVVDPDGKPVPEATVLAAFKDHDSYPRDIVVVSKVRSEEDGSFVLGPVGRREHWVLAIKKDVGVGYANGKAPGAFVELVLSEGARVSGKITDVESGQPVANARVIVTDWSFWMDTTTDDEGKYLLAPVPPTVNMWSGHRVMVVAEGHRRAERNNLILKNRVEQKIDFALDKGAVLAGKVVDAQTLQPIPKAIIAEGWESYHESAESDENGAFKLEQVDTAPNRMFTVRAEGYLPQQRQSDGTGALEFQLNKSEVLEGIVVNRLDQPVAGARVYLHRFKYEHGHQPQGGGSGRWRNRTETDEAGKFRFENVLPGEVGVAAFDKDHAPGESEKIKIQLGVKRSGDLRVRLREGVTVEGEVRDTQDQPIPNIRVQLQRWGFQAKGYKYAHYFIWSEQPSWYSDEKGKFVLKGAIPGSLWLSVWDQTYGWTGKQVKGEEGQRIDGVILSFAGESIEGVFVDHNGVPVPGAWINAQGPKNTPQRTWRWTSTDALGRFKLAGLKAGDY